MKVYDKRLASPYLVWMALFTVIPLLIVCYYALTDSEGRFTLANLVSVSGYGSVFARSLLLALIATVICLVIAFPVGYFLSRLRVNKQRIMDVLQTAMRVYYSRARRIPTSELNEYLLPIIEETPPPSTKGKYIRIKYATQLPSPTPAFAFFVNLPQYIKEPYRRFLENKIREQWDFCGVPMQIFFRQK